MRRTALQYLDDILESIGNMKNPAPVTGNIP